MKIISITRRMSFEKPGHIIPSNFTVGEAPTEDSPAVEKIAAMRGGKLDMFPDACYIVHFTKSKVRRIIPASEVIDIAYDTAKEEKNEVAAVAPELPEGDD